MTIKLYVHWNDEEILNETQWAKKITETAEEIYKDDDELNEWLNDEYAPADLLRMNEAVREQVLKDWAEHSKDCAVEALLTGYGAEWEMREVEV